MAVIVRVELTLLRALERSCCLYNVQFHYHYKKWRSYRDSNSSYPRACGSTNRYTIGPMDPGLGFEPRFSAPKADDLPLVDPGIKNKNGANSRTRTYDLMLPKHADYQLSHIHMAESIGFEPMIPVSQDAPLAGE